MLTVVNEVANAFKHSFVQSDINVIGRDEPCVNTLSLDSNKPESGTRFHSVSLVWLAKEFTAFYKEGIDWLRAFSECVPQSASVMNKGMMSDREWHTRRFCLDQKSILLQGKQL